MVLLDRRRDDALNTNAVAAHDNRNWLSLFGQNRGAHRLGILRSEFEYVADLHRLENFQRAYVAARAALAGRDAAQVGPLIWFDVALNFDAAQVVVVFVGAG